MDLDVTRPESEIESGVKLMTDIIRKHVPRAISRRTPNTLVFTLPFSQSENFASKFRISDMYLNSIHCVYISLASSYFGSFIFQSTFKYSLTRQFPN